MNLHPTTFGIGFYSLVFFCFHCFVHLLLNSFEPTALCITYSFAVEYGQLVAGVTSQETAVTRVLLQERYRRCTLQRRSPFIWLNLTF